MSRCGSGGFSAKVLEDMRCVSKGRSHGGVVEVSFSGKAASIEYEWPIVIGLLPGVGLGAYWYDRSFKVRAKGRG